MELPRLIVVTDWTLPDEAHRAALETVAALGPEVCIQHRDPGAPVRGFLERARWLSTLTGRSGAQLAVNGRLDVALLVDAVPAAADPLNGAANALGRGDHHHAIHGADVDAQLQAGAAHDGAEFACLELVFHFQPHIAVQGGVMSFDLIGKLGQRVLEPHGDALRAAAGVAENDDAALLLHEPRKVLHHPLRCPARGWIGFAPQR